MRPKGRGWRTRNECRRSLLRRTRAHGERARAPEGRRGSKTGGEVRIWKDAIIKAGRLRALKSQSRRKQRIATPRIFTLNNKCRNRRWGKKIADTTNVASTRYRIHRRRRRLVDGDPRPVLIDHRRRSFGTMEMGIRKISIFFDTWLMIVLIICNSNLVPLLVRVYVHVDLALLVWSPTLLSTHVMYVHVLEGNGKCHREGRGACKRRGSDQGPARPSTTSSAPNTPLFLWL